MKIIKLLPKQIISTSNIYLCEHNGQNGVFKMFLLPGSKFERFYNDYITDQSKTEELLSYKQKIDGLLYESSVYSEIAEKITSSNLSPNFLSTLPDGSGEIKNGWYISKKSFVSLLIESGTIRVSNPSIDTATKLCAAAFSDSRTPLEAKALNDFIYNLQQLSVPPKELIEKLKVSTLGLRTMTAGEKIDDDLKEAVKVICMLADNLKVVGTVTERINNSTTLETLLLNLRPDIDEDVRETKNLMFQVVSALYLMHVIGLQHNDLHLTNIMVKALPRPINLNYLVKFYNERGEKIERRYQLNTIFVVKFFDWDISFMDSSLFQNDDPKSNINKKLDSDLYRRIGVLNMIIPYFDVFTLSCLLTDLCKANPRIPLSTLKLLDIFYRDQPKTSSADANTSRPSLFSLGYLTDKFKSTTGQTKRSISHHDGFVSWDGFQCRPNKNTEKLSQVFATFPEMLDRLSKSLGDAEVSSFGEREVVYTLEEVPNFFDIMTSQGS